MTQTAGHVTVPSAPALMTRVRHAQAPEPSACRWCGTGEREHGWRFSRSAGQHGFAAPTAAQRLARMKTRRAARLRG